MEDYTKANKYFDQLTMVCKSVAKEATRYALCHIEVNEKHIVATDGRRMACLDNFGIEPGRYMVHRCTKTQIVIMPVDVDGNFCSYQDILPENIRGDEKIKISDGVFAIKDGRLTSLLYNIAKHGACLPVSFVKDFQAADSFHVISGDRPVAFYAQNFVCIIMPVDGNK